MGCCRDSTLRLPLSGGGCPVCTVGVLLRLVRRTGPEARKCSNPHCQIVFEPNDSRLRYEGTRPVR
jgi:hypothetical protein